ncbi:RNA polymerase sigma factor SigX [Bacillus sp. FJAT-44742]|uniref:RNA polymerase sigma factor SigX n=1 Tax=Bacillus sp. FJAT-44742 TaxID=2014005 RepID=UPI002FCD20BA
MVNEEFDRIYETYHQSLFQYLFYLVKNRDTAEELVQEVYIKVFQSYAGFEGKSSEKTWLYSVARHVGIDWIRKQNRQKRKWLGLFSVASEEEIKDPSPLPDEIVMSRDGIQMIYSSLQKCNLDQQQVIILRYIDSLTIKETAEILNWSESKVKTTQHRAIQKLKELTGEVVSSAVKEGEG